MKFAKHWQSIAVAVNKDWFGRSEVAVWGASDTSAEEAGRQAQSRAERFKTLLSRGLAALREYEYWNGYIREEVVEEITAADGRVLAVLTRNSYGATVLNTESVLFGDIDIAEPGLFSRLLTLFGRPLRDESYYLKRIEDYQKSQPQLSFKVYRTCAGLRFVITNASFQPESKAVVALFTALGVDPLYRHLCRQQTCYRARLTPKPWRLGLERPDSRFPRNEREQAQFERWLQQYRLAASRKSVTRLLKTMGTANADPDIAHIIELHDRYACTSAAELA